MVAVQSVHKNFVSAWEYTSTLKGDFFCFLIPTLLHPAPAQLEKEKGEHWRLAGHVHHTKSNFKIKILLKA
jgi:hypothetical protein